MYCPSCGAESSEQLRYCRSCGTGLNLVPAAPAATGIPFRFMFLFLLIAIVGVIGLVSILMTAQNFTRQGLLTSQDMMGLLLLSAAMTLIIMGLLSWLLSQMIKFSRPSEGPALSKPPSVERPPVAQMNPRPEFAPSVVEPTTRNFEPMPRTDPAAQRPRN